MVNAYRTDPQQSHMLRKAFVSAMLGRFRTLSGAVNRLVIEEDAFNLAKRISVNSRYVFQSDSQKINSFRVWLQDQIDRGLLSTNNKGEPWLAEFIESSYKKAVARSYVESNKLRLSGDSKLFEGTKKDFVKGILNTSQTTKQLELLYTRAFESLRGVTAQLASSMSRTLAESFANGLGARTTARNLNTATQLGRKRSLVVARTELAHAYAEGQLDAYQRLGVEKLGVLAEWLTAGDDLVCQQCLALSGEVYTMKEARGLIPLHPNCRCAWLPYLDAEPAPKR